MSDYTRYNNPVPGEPPNKNQHNQNWQNPVPPQNNQYYNNHQFQQRPNGQMPPNKEPLYKNKGLWILAGIVLLIVVSAIGRTIRINAEEKAQAKLEENADKLLEGKVKIPNTQFKTREEVEKLLSAAGLEVEFVISNFDDTAELSEHYLRKDECDGVNTDQATIEYFSSDEVGDRSGYYAENGATIIVGYSDHDFNGRASRENKEELIEEEVEAKEQTKDEAKASEKVEPKDEKTEKKSTESTGNDEIENYDEVTAAIAADIELYKGWATGTIDNNGNPIENGEIYSEYAAWIYVNSIYHDGAGWILSVTMDFAYLPESHKNLTAGQAQGTIRMNIEGMQDLPFLIIENGQIPIGCSKALDVSEFKWEEY